MVIDTNLAYQGEQAAGTGMVLTSSGEVLTNNHVIRGATTVKVVVPATGRSYSASVVGYDVSDDVAVLQASGASNLKTASLGRLVDGRRRRAREGGRKRRRHRPAHLRLRRRDRSRPRDHREQRPGREREVDGSDRDERCRAAGRFRRAAAERRPARSSGWTRPPPSGTGPAGGDQRRVCDPDQQGDVDRAADRGRRRVSHVHVGGTAFLGVEVESEQLRRLRRGRRVGGARQPRRRCGPRSPAT